MPSRENLYMLSVMYKHKRITVGVGMGNPFVDNYKRINETWNFQFGRNYQSGGKKIWNQDTDTGVMNTSNIMNFCRPCLVLFIISAIFRIFTAYYGL